MNLHQIKLLLCLAALRFASAAVVSVKEDVKESEGARVGHIKYHYESAAAKSCSYVLVVGVGFTMGVDDYDNVAGRISNGTSIVVVVSDHNVGGMIKTSASQYARLANELQGQIGSLIPVCASSKPKILLGGHSSSGQAALAAVQGGLFKFTPQGFVGLDPFQITNGTMSNKALPASLPTLNWGLQKGTCLVGADQAARGAYSFSSSKAGRVLYAIDNRNNRMAHCVFTDYGCGGFICSTHKSFDWVYESVAESIRLFVDALNRGADFTEDMFRLTSTESAVSLEVNGS